MTERAKKSSAFGRSGEIPTNAEVALWFVSKRPGITEADLAEAMFGERNQPRVHQEVDFLEGKGLLRRDRSQVPMLLYSEVSK